ncbi:MAG: hypothetical protein HXL25_02135 [Porphyromonadaceae bacterium]|nr:hypothetical protein [Porphyromonadaceae bacterium]
MSLLRLFIRYGWTPIWFAIILFKVTVSALTLHEAWLAFLLTIISQSILSSVFSLPEDPDY